MGGAEMPRYRCHKEVWALKIAAIEFFMDGSARIMPSDDRYGPIDTKPDYRAKFHGGKSYGDDPDLGYYVVYDDGYASWSPTKAFEDGYALVS